MAYSMASKQNDVPCRLKAQAIPSCEERQTRRLFRSEAFTARGTFVFNVLPEESIVMDSLKIGFFLFQRRGA